jgi:hypothetical protein
VKLELIDPNVTKEEIEEFLMTFPPFFWDIGRGGRRFGGLRRVATWGEIIYTRTSLGVSFKIRENG